MSSFCSANRPDRPCLLELKNSRSLFCTLVAKAGRINEISQLVVKVFNLKDPDLPFTLALIILLAQTVVYFFNNSDHYVLQQFIWMPFLCILNKRHHYSLYFSCFWSFLLLIFIWNRFLTDNLDLTTISCLHFIQIILKNSLKSRLE